LAEAQSRRPASAVRRGGSLINPDDDYSGTVRGDNQGESPFRGLIQIVALHGTGCRGGPANRLDKLLPWNWRPLQA
jgi:hypothetical protein